MVLGFTLANPFDFFSVITGIALLMKKLSEMERHHDLRALVLTTFLACVAIYVFNCVYVEAGLFYDCGFPSDFTSENM